MKRDLIWFVPAVCVALGIFLLSTFLAFPVQIEEVSYFDKIEHCFAYLVLILSFLIAFKKTNRLTNGMSIKLLLISSLYGFGLEFTQYVFFPNRFFEWVDAIANVLGAVLGFLVFKLFDRG
ncbi:VanZ family protein [Ekhidna sp.]|uniref:VanZ family protein n=1 Tax=Ekhidna sp. TaxID=2608089 RepID=UPI003519137A